MNDRPDGPEHDGRRATPGSRRSVPGRLASALILVLLLLLPAAESLAQSADRFAIARIKYGGGGDWYNDRSSEINLLRFVADVTGMSVRPAFEPVEITSDLLFSYPLCFLTGHGNVRFTDDELVRLRAYLDNGGFLYVDDDYGLDTAFRREAGRLFPDRPLVEIPWSHPIYSSFYDFSRRGLPKIHEHDGLDPIGLGLFDRTGRLCLFYTVETNLADGWADADVHGNPPEKREDALKFGTNIVVWVTTGGTGRSSPTR